MIDDNSFKDDESLQEVKAVSGMYEEWFLDYASYVILERAVPAIEDGFKPVQRRIMHAMKEMDDGRYNKVANIIGQTMQYHPHGDASITEAMVNMGQKDLLIDTQGNWGDMRTGDGAAAARYIEARLSKFALDVIFNPQTTNWQLSYDGRKREPVTLPVKFPLLLAQGVEGIAVGLSTKILPHNFCELIEASILILRNESFQIFPDFLTGGLIDISNYNDGLRSGKVRVRSKIEELDKKTLIIKDIPYGTTTTSIMESIVKAKDAGKIKIKKVVDNTAKEVEILINLEAGASPDITIDALFAFTDCEVIISPNACLIINDKPIFTTVSEIIKVATENTVNLLKQELEIKKSELLEKILYSSLEKIFIENRIYRDIEEIETWEEVINTVDKGLEPFKKDFYRQIVEDDILRLLEIRIKRISRFDAFKADELMKKLEEDLADTEDHLNNMVRFAINYYKDLLKRYGKGRERKTEIKNFESINASVVAAANAKLFLNKKDGFIGYGLKKDENTEFVTDCSDIDEIIVFRKDGKFLVTKIHDKSFVGKDILHAAVFKKNDERMVFNMVYVDGKEGTSYVKRFQVQGITRDKEYDLTKGNPNSKVIYFTVNPNAEAEIISVQLTPASKARLKQFEYNFFELEIKGRSAQGNILTKYPIKKITHLENVGSTLGGIDIYFDESIGRLNIDKRGKLLGNFDNGDSILAVYKNGEYELTNFEITNRYENIELIEKYKPDNIITAVYFDSSAYFVKRFKIETTSLDKKFLFITESKGSKLMLVTTDVNPLVEMVYENPKNKQIEKMEYDLDVMGKVQGWKSAGTKLTSNKVINMQLNHLIPEKSEEIEEKPSEPVQIQKNEDKDIGKNTQLGLF